MVYCGGIADSFALCRKEVRTGESVERHVRPGFSIAVTHLPGFFGLDLCWIVVCCSLMICWAVVRRRPSGPYNDLAMINHVLSKGLAHATGCFLGSFSLVLFLFGVLQGNSQMSLFFPTKTSLAEDIDVDWNSLSDLGLSQRIDLLVGQGRVE